MSETREICKLMRVLIYDMMDDIVEGRGLDG